MLTFEDEELAARLQHETGKSPVVPARFLAFTDLEENVREQIRKVRSHPWIPESIPVPTHVSRVTSLKPVERTYSF